MNEVYIVTKGSYSDYHICGVFTSFGNAQKYIDAFKGDSKYSFDEMQIETYPLDPYEQELNDGCHPYFVRIAKNGDILEVKQRDTSYGFDKGESLNFDVHLNMLVYAMSSDTEHAVKIAGERRAKMIAENLWPEERKAA